jgi:hypothetical protein
MTEISEIALAFAKECMGWKDASIDSSFGCIGNGKLPGNAVLDFSDLNAIMDAGSEWCRAHYSYLKITYFYGIDEYGVEINNPAFNVEKWAADKLLTRAIMSACLETQRKLKGAPCT